MLGEVQLAVLLALLLAGTGCGFDSSATGGGRDGGGGDVDGTPGADAPRGTSDGGGGDSDAEPAVNPFCAASGDLVACYEFDGNLEDSSVNNNDLTGDNITFTTGKDGQALLTGQSAKIDPQNDPSLDFTDALTMEAWILPSQSQTRWVMDHQAQWGLLLEDDKIGCTVVTVVDEDPPSGHTIKSDPGSVPEDDWTHVACTYDGTQIVLYIDGVPQTPLLATGSIDTAPDQGFTVAQDAPDGAAFLGRTDRARVWSVARSALQIQSSL